MNKTLNYLLALVFVACGVICYGGSDVAGVVRLSGSGDTLAAKPADAPTKRRTTQVRLVSTNANKSYVIRAGTSASGTKLWEGYGDKDEHDTAFSAGTTHTMTWLAEFEVPSTGLYLETDDTSTSGAIYLYARPDNSK